MGQTEQKIDHLTTQIEDVSYQIETVETYLKKPSSSWTEEEKDTYGTKDQLRIKKEQLRSEEERLRELLIENERQKTQGLVMKEPIDVDIYKHISIETLELDLRSMIHIDGTGY